jgi:hypothetical protein
MWQTVFAAATVRFADNPDYYFQKRSRYFSLPQKLQNGGVAEFNQACLINNLQAGQSNELVVSKLENPVKTGHCEDAFGCGGDVTEQKSVPAVRQQLAQLQEFRQARRGYYVDLGKIDYHFAVAPVPNDLGNGL